MKKIDITGWAPFRIDSLFSLKKGKRLTKADMTKGEINYIGATAFHNGITAKIGNNEHLHPGGLITVAYNGSVGASFYQEEAFWASDDVNVLYPKFDEYNKNIGLFICSEMRRLGNKYQFVNKWLKETMEQDQIYLPIKEDGKPNWEFITDYIQKKLDIAHRELRKRQDSFSKHKIDHTLWKKFRVCDLFQIEFGKCPSASLYKDGKTRYVGASILNNGVMKYIEVPNELINKGNCIVFICNGDGACGYNLYEEEDFCGSKDVKIGYNEHLNKFNGLFLVTALNKNRGIYNYGFATKRTLTALKNETVSLPCTETGDPDWLYMAEYIKRKFRFAKMHFDTIK